MGKSILLIEDNLEMRENTAEILELASYKVTTAENGKIGVKKAKEVIPDLIICDIMMPEMDGYETLYLLGKNDETKHIPFIFLTAKTEKSDLRKGMNLGADDYLTKPFEEMELLQAIEMRLQKTENLKQEFESSAAGLSQFMDTARGMEALRSLSENKKGKVYRKREVLFHEGDYAGAVFFIERGKIKTYKINDDGKEYTTGLFKAGDFVGYTALLKESEHPDAAVALEESEVFRIHKDDFNALLYNNREVAHAFIRILSGSLIEKEQELLNLAYNSVRKRVADSLVLLQKKYGESSEQKFSIAIPRDDLASIVGTSTESVIRVLSDFKDEGLIEAKGSNITILNEEKLANMRF